MKNRSLWRLRSGGGESRAGQGGQSLIVIVLAFIALLAFIGLAVDLAVVYVERVRLARAADAAALAAVSELPLEAAAQQRALIYLQENGYDFTDEERVATVIDGVVVTDTTDLWLTATVSIDTAYARADLGPGVPNEDTATRIRVRVTNQVPMTFLQFIGFKKLAVDGVAEAENITDLDLVVVFDRSGSMDFDTVCYGCFNQSTEETFPLPWSQTSAAGDADHCAGWDGGTNNYTSSCYGDASFGSAGFGGYDENDCAYRDGSGTAFDPYEYYIVIEAEEYSFCNYGDAPYHPALRHSFQSYWAVQHNGRGSTGRDDDEGYIRHHPYHLYGDGWTGSPDGNAVACTWTDLNDPDSYGRPVCRRKWATDPAVPDPDGTIGPGPADGYPTPRCDYEFITQHASGNETYHFFIRAEGGDPANPKQHIFWGVDEGIKGEVTGFPNGTTHGGANWGWQWHELGTESLGAGEVHELNLWAGAAGFSVDRIVITTESSAPSDIRTADANAGRTREACNRCDVRYGGRPAGGTSEGGWWYHPNCAITMTVDALYDGSQPLGFSKNAVRRFIEKMDFRYDQVGYVSYSSGASTATWFEDLQCLRQNPGICDGDVITSTVVASLLDTSADGGTNIAGGIKLGMGVLNAGNCSAPAPRECGRPGSASIMIVLTDGQPNSFDGIDRNTCRSAVDRWPGALGNAEHDGAECALYWADRAAGAGIIVYTITIGDNADQELMAAVAEEGGGEYLGGGNEEQLNYAFDQLIERIFVKLVR